MNTVWEISDGITINGVKIWNKNQLLMNKILDEITSLDHHSGKKLEKAVNYKHLVFIKISYLLRIGLKTLKISIYAWNFIQRNH